MPNPNVMMQEMFDRLAYAKAQMTNPKGSKNTKEMWLRVVRQLEKELELPEDQCTKGYNRAS